MRWHDTGYILAVAINDEAKSSDVWLLYDLEPFNEDTQESCSIPEGWGQLKGDEVRWAGVRIADSIEKLGDQGVWTMDRWFGGKYELVRTLKQEERPYIVRQLRYRAPEEGEEMADED